jgi:hypothetical protein
MQEIVNAVRQAVPDAGSKPPGAVLEHVLGALRPKSRLMAISANAIGGKLYAPRRCEMRRHPRRMPERIEGHGRTARAQNRVTSLNVHASFITGNVD